MGGDLKEAPKTVGRPRSTAVKSAANGKGRFVSFNPTKEEKETLKSSQMTLEEVMLSIESCLQDGHKVTLQYHSDHDCYSAVVRDGTVPWEQALALSCWHHSLERALRMLDYCLTIKHPEFPRGVFETSYNDLYW